ncbi:hypothetical protein ES708_07230 [subsurface metagenome]|jgi:hypothetical protein
MTVDEAIRILNLDIESASSTPPADLDEAEKLGIEALKQIKQIRAYAKELYLPLLPGETGE